MSFLLTQSFPLNALLTCAAAGGHGGGGGGGSFPPFHPILVNFTAALIPASFAADLLGAWFRKDGLRATGWWTLLLAAIVTPFTAAIGWLWMNSMGHMDHWQMSYHQWIGVSIAAATLLMVAWRGWLWRHSRGPGWGYGLVAAPLLAALLVQGDLGGSMSFGRGIVISVGEGGGHEHGGGGGRGHNAGGQGHGEHEHDGMSGGSRERGGHTHGGSAQGGHQHDEPQPQPAAGAGQREQAQEQIQPPDRSGEPHPHEAGSPGGGDPPTGGSEVSRDHRHESALP